jgi:signal transduction histidine kinase
MATPLTSPMVEEQDALRRVAMLVAAGAQPDEVFAAVVAEAGRLLGGDHTVLARRDQDDAITYASTWPPTGVAAPPSVGNRFPLGGHNVSTMVCRTGRPARIDQERITGAMADVVVHRWGVRSAVGVPIIVEARVWGVLIVASTREQPLPSETETRLSRFTELVAMALANAQARVELRGYAEEQSALRRVATLVARGAPPEDVFAAVAAEEGRLLGTGLTLITRYNRDGTGTVVGSWSDTGVPMPFPAGTLVPLDGRTVIAGVYETGHAVRIDDYTEAHGGVADDMKGWGVRSAIAAPITIEGRLWGVISMGFTGPEPLPARAEVRLAAFTELIATAVANAQTRVELRGYAEEQSALRRVATLVARAAPSETVFAAVAEEAGKLLQVDFTVIVRYDADGAVTSVGQWAGDGDAGLFPTGNRLSLGGRNVTTMVFETGRSAGIDGYENASGAIGKAFGARGVRSATGVPITVDRRLWGAMVVGSRARKVPLGTEDRLKELNELVATALANAEAQAELSASRARLLAASDTSRRRIERDLRQGAQRRLAELAMYLRGPVCAAVPPAADELVTQVEQLADEVTDVLDELREIAGGLHPTALAQGGLEPALTTLARRSSIPVRLGLDLDGRLPEPVELAAYYTVAEALTNAAKHAQASTVDVDVEISDGRLHVRVSDDGRGGADPAAGSGLIGLTDRAESLGGVLTLRSQADVGTTVEITVPLPPPDLPLPRGGRDSRLPAS